MAFIVHIVGSDLVVSMRKHHASKRAGLRKAQRKAALSVRDRWASRTRSRRIARGLKVVHEGGMRYSITSQEPFAHFEEVDTKPHDIVARPGKVLRFKIGGNVLYRKRVRHPGTKGSHAAEKALLAESLVHRKRVANVLKEV